MRRFGIMENNENIVKLVQGVGGLVTLPNVFIRINQLVEDPNSSTADIAKTASQDPSFTLRLLRVANSSFYGFPSTIDTVAKAVSVIGTSQIRNLALSMSVARSFDGLPNNLVSMDNFWHHSLYCALVARILAKQARKCDPEAVFTAGLLHDIGELIIFNRLPEQAKESLLLVLDQVDDLPVYLAEHDIILPDLLTDLQDKTQLTRRTIARILTESGDNPARFVKASTLEDLLIPPQ